MSQKSNGTEPHDGIHRDNENQTSIFIQVLVAMRSRVKAKDVLLKTQPMITITKLIYRRLSAGGIISGFLNSVDVSANDPHVHSPCGKSRVDEEQGLVPESVDVISVASVYRHTHATQMMESSHPKVPLLNPSLHQSRSPTIKPGMMTRSQQIARMIGPWFWASITAESAAMMVRLGSSLSQNV